MRNRALFLKLAQDIRASYWFIPAALVLAALALAHASEWVDRHTGMLPFQLPAAFIDTQVDGARSTLSTIATSVIGVTGVMFSMTVVAVSFAAGNYGPRLIGNFMRDRGNQISLGILIATFVYALSILRAVQDPSEASGVDAFVPQYSMLIAMIGCVIAVFAMIYFVHHVPETINVSNITANLGRQLELEVTKMIEADAELTSSSAPEVPDSDPDNTVSLLTAGYIQTLNYDQIEALSTRENWTIRVDKLPGDFVTRYTTVVSVWAGDSLSDQQVTELRDCYAVGTSRTEHQNVLFLVDELVEMLARALSPGVNDPFTAINCLNWMHNALKVSQFQGDGMVEDGARKHLFQPKMTYDTLFQRSFEASLPYCEGDHLAHAHYKMLVADLQGKA
ncbi:DUF2254 domain-containing protein [Roseobacter sp. YSTF-M11]|uniref:DUF2254 domain-containing protein n=1 Tax=Roseobacter insulae TaxID=2859783 RepID=A0A9X1FTE1_9RHOB|nr:DUF2254 domain-containing protein [Roseobacter insulae]MBW4707450.1 DUF2254 domain-containing protein [Roseobacter insulae]